MYNRACMFRLVHMCFNWNLGAMHLTNALSSMITGHIRNGVLCYAVIGEL